MDTMDAVIRCGHIVILTSNQTLRSRTQIKNYICFIDDNSSHLSQFGCNLGAIGMKQGGNNGHNGQFSHSLVYCMDIMDAIPHCGHKEQLTLNQ